jgi:hypothetical protein
MMMRILNSREKKRLADALAKEYGTDPKLFDGLDVLESGRDVWVSSRACLMQDLKGLSVDSIGLQIIRDGAPTIHGVQLLFDGAKSHELAAGAAREFIDGKTVAGEGNLASYGGHMLDLAEETDGGIRRGKRR